MATESSQQSNHGLIRQYIAHQPTMPYRAITSTEAIITPQPLDIPETHISQTLPETPEKVTPPLQATKKPRIRRAVAVVLVCMLGLGAYFIWHASSDPTTAALHTTQQQFSLVPTAATPGTGTTASAVATNGKIQVYIVGAVKNPGVYTLAGGARIYNLLQAAGGPLAQANLVALNLAAPLSDGEEIYVTRIGETPPVSMSNAPSTPSSTATRGTPVSNTAALININTASADELRTTLHISSKNAQAIITYRTQHGSYTSVEELLQVLSQATYKKIKNEVKLA